MICKALQLTQRELNFKMKDQKKFSSQRSKEEQKERKGILLHDLFETVKEKKITSNIYKQKQEKDDIIKIKKIRRERKREERERKEM